MRETFKNSKTTLLQSYFWNYIILNQKRAPMSHAKYSWKALQAFLSQNLKNANQFLMFM